MGHEIERRFLVNPDFDPVPHAYKTVQVEQSYLANTGDWTIRARQVRYSGGNVSHYLTFKQFVSGATNIEIETFITLEMYRSFTQHTKSTLSKTRYYIKHAGHTWEVDVYSKDHPDFQAICEVELTHEDEPLVIPDWILREVTHDRSFSNAALAARLTET